MSGSRARGENVDDGNLRWFIPFYYDTGSYAVSLISDRNRHNL